MMHENSSRSVQLRSLLARYTEAQLAVRTAEDALLDAKQNENQLYQEIWRLYDAICTEHASDPSATVYITIDDYTLVVEKSTDWSRFKVHRSIAML